MGGGGCAHDHEGGEAKGCDGGAGHGHSHGDSKDKDGGHGHAHGEEKTRRNINVDAAFLHALGDMIMSIGVCLAASIIYF